MVSRVWGQNFQSSKILPLNLIFLFLRLFSSSFFMIFHS